MGCKIDRSEIKTCKWISHTKYIRRKRCCTHAKICKCAKCHLVKIKCSVCNRCIIRRQPKKSCSTKKKLEDMELKNNVVNGFISVEENYVKNLIKNVKLQELQLQENANILKKENILKWEDVVHIEIFVKEKDVIQKKIKCGICKKHTIRRHPKRCCKVKPYKNGQRSRCCRWFKVCKGGKCHNKNVRCHWGNHHGHPAGFKRKCAIKKFFCKKVGKHGEKRRCCDFIHGKRTKCYWVGKAKFF